MILNTISFEFSIDPLMEKFSVTGMTYDRNGNIQTLNRQGITQKLTPLTNYTTGTVGNLTYTYNGNQLKKVAEANTTSWLYEGIQTYHPALDEPYDNLYDANGSLTFAGDYGLTIENNIHNLPARITDLQGNIVQIVYDAQGQKISYTDNSKPHTNKLYSNGFVYQNETLTYMPLPEGYYSDGEYFAAITDYLGSVRVVLKNNASAYTK